MTKIHEIDPSSDTVITLKNLLAYPAVCDPPDEEALDDKDSALPIDLPVEEHSTEGSVVAPSEPDDSSYEVIEYHVSSSVLKLASSHFNRMLSGTDWKEGIPNEDDGRYHISCQDWDEEAFLILLNALHLRNRQVPRSLPLDMLVKVAQLIEYYGFLEAVELWTKMWIEDLKKSTPIPEYFGYDLMRWMYVAWVFELSEEFTQTTVIVIKRSRITPSSLPNIQIERHLDRIQQARNEAIGTVVAQLHNLLDKYRNPEYNCPEGDCSFECGSILYGALTKGMDSLNLLSPYPQAPFPGLSFEDICTKVRSMKSPCWSPDTYSRYNSEHSCRLSEQLVPIVDGVLNTITGLQLTDFARI